MAHNASSANGAKTNAATTPDAGLQGHDHYVRKLPEWRFQLRETLLPLVRWETPYLAQMQRVVRSPALDSYFAMTANLGTHTFFMTALPILFWCGYPVYGRALVHMLALGVFWSGWIKDLVCLPRPLSPPLQRITMSGSAALEYGFPSTHSTNAVSVALYLIYELQFGRIDLTPQLQTPALIACYCYATSIILGRVYCGMHGYFDVVIGALLGALLAAVQVVGGASFDAWIENGSWTSPALCILVILLAVRFHPEPADNCPCFDDSVSFAGVIMGIEAGHWHYSSSPYSWSDPSPGTVPFDLAALGWTKTVARILVGVIAIFLWRAIMKPFLLKFLPPLFRQIEYIGLSLPRRFFTKASQYTKVPTLRRDDNVIPQAREIPAFLTSLRHPRKRTVSIGPQSEADAREMIAQRENKRRESQNSDRPEFGQSMSLDLPSPLIDEADLLDEPPTPVRTDSKEPLHVAVPTLQIRSPSPSPSQKQQEKQQDMKMFEALLQPRVRYDVEVVTKLVVYAGIAWLAVEGNPLLFDAIGLGMPQK